MTLVEREGSLREEEQSSSVVAPPAASRSIQGNSRSASATELEQVAAFFRGRKEAEDAERRSLELPLRDRKKVCTKCGQEKYLIKHFYRNRNAFDGRSAQCKKCLYKPVENPKRKGNFGNKRRTKAQRVVLVEKTVELRRQGLRFDQIGKALGICPSTASYYCWSGGGFYEGIQHLHRCWAPEDAAAKYRAQQELERQQRIEAARLALLRAREQGVDPWWHVPSIADALRPDARQQELDALIARQAKDMQWEDRADFVNKKWMFSLDAPIERQEDNEPIQTTYLELLHASEDSDPAKRLEKEELTDLLAGLDEQTVARMNDETLEHYRDKLRDAGYAGRGVPSGERERLKVIEPRKGVSGKPERLAIPAEDVEADLNLRSGTSKKDRRARAQSRKGQQSQDMSLFARNRGVERPRYHNAPNHFRRLDRVGGGNSYPLGKGGSTPRRLTRRQEREVDRIWMVMDGWMIAEAEVVV